MQIARMESEIKISADLYSNIQNEQNVNESSTNAQRNA